MMQNLNGVNLSMLNIADIFNAIFVICNMKNYKITKSKDSIHVYSFRL